MDPIKRAAKIKEALFVRGLTLADIDRAYGLPAGAARTTLREPNAKGEAALAAALACEPKELWPERYGAGGQRLKPQPYASKSHRLPTLEQRRKGKAA